MAGNNGDLEAVKEEILREMRKEITKAKQEIIDGKNNIIQMNFSFHLPFTLNLNNRGDYIHNLNKKFVFNNNKRANSANFVPIQRRHIFKRYFQNN